MISRPPSSRLQRTVVDKVPRHIGPEPPLNRDVVPRPKDDPHVVRVLEWMLRR
jgi:hypothetical protein